VIFRLITGAIATGYDWDFVIWSLGIFFCLCGRRCPLGQKPLLAPMEIPRSAAISPADFPTIAF
jgi:hypothetical protein